MCFTGLGSVLGWSVWFCVVSSLFFACGPTTSGQEQNQQETVATETTSTQENTSSHEIVVESHDGSVASDATDVTENSPAEQNTDTAVAETSGSDHSNSGAGFVSAVAPIFKEKTCVNDYCHGLSKAGGLDLTEAKAYQQLVNQKGSQGVWVRVVPGDPDKSLLYEKLSKKAPAEGSQMPTTGDYLDADQLKRVYNWIKAGAVR